MIESVLLVKALVLVGLLAGFPSVVAFKILAQKMHSALVFFLLLMHQLYAQTYLLKTTPSACFTSIAVQFGLNETLLKRRCFGSMFSTTIHNATRVCIAARSVIVGVVFYGQFSWLVFSLRSAWESCWANELNLFKMLTWYCRSVFEFDCFAHDLIIKHVFMCSSISALTSFLHFCEFLIVFMARAAFAAKVSSKIYRLSCRYFHHANGFCCAWPVTAQFPSDTSEQNGAPSQEQRGVQRHNIPIAFFINGYLLYDKGELISQHRPCYSRTGGGGLDVYRQRPSVC